MSLNDFRSRLLYIDCIWCTWQNNCKSFFLFYIIWRLMEKSFYNSVIHILKQETLKPDFYKYYTCDEYFT